MEKLNSDVNYKNDFFVSRWKKWMDYITPRRPDFDLFIVKTIACPRVCVCCAIESKLLLCSDSSWF